MIALTMPAYQIECAFGAAPLSIPGSWTDITRWCQAGSTKRGRQHELQRFEAGTLKLTLNNRDGRFSQWNTAGPYYPNLVPSTPIKISVTWAGTTYPVFYGFVDSWVPQYGSVKSEMVINATDAMQLLSLANLDQSAYPAQVIADGANAYWRCGDPPGSRTFADFTGNGHTGLVEGDIEFGQNGALLTDLDTSALWAGAGWMAAPLTPPSSGTVAFAFWINTTNNVDQTFLDLPAGQSAGNIFTNRVAMIGASGALAITFGNAELAPSLQSFCLGGPVINDGNWHFIVVSVPCGSSPSLFTLWCDGLLYGSNSAFTWASFPPTFGGIIQYTGFVVSYVPDFIGDMDEIAYFTAALSTAKVDALFQLGSAGWATPQFSGQRIASVLATYGWPTGMETLATGISEVQAATSSLTTTSALSYIQTVEATEQGFFFVDESGNLVFRDRHYILTASAAIVSNGYFASDHNPSHFQYLVGSIVPTPDDLDLWNDVPVSLQGSTTTERALNRASVTQFGYRTLQGFTGMLQTSDTEALAMAEWLLAHYDAPLVRVRQVAMDNTNRAGANFPQMLGRQLLDRVTIDWLPLDGTTVHFIQDSLIESIQHDFTQDTWKTTWGLSPAETQQYFTLDSATLGTLDSSNRLAY